MTKNDEPRVDCEGASDRAVLRGVMRLESVDAYEELFAPISERVAATSEAYSIDISAVPLMNSSGIRALASLVLEAKRAGCKLVLIGRQSVAWQRKSVPSLQALCDELDVQLH